MAENPSARKPVDIGNRLLEAMLELARSAIRNDNAATEQRAKLTVVTGGRKAA